MTDLFIDTDVIIDFLIDRKPHSREAAVIFTLIEQKKIKGYASSLTFSNLYYVLRKIESHNKVKSKLESLSQYYWNSQSRGANNKRMLSHLISLTSRIVFNISVH